MKPLLISFFAVSTFAIAAEEPKPAAPEAKPNEAKQAAEGFLSQLGEIGVEKFGKKASEILALYAPTIQNARLSTAQVFAKDGTKQLALATVVSEKGYLISKASELEKTPNLELVFAKSDVFPKGLRMGGKILDTYRPYDLALIKVDASGLKPAVFETSEAPAPGTFLAAAGIDELPITHGVASVNTRNLDDANKGFLGVMLQSTEQGLSIERVTKNSAAYDAGLKEKDIVLKVNGSVVASVEEFIRTIGSIKPSEKVQIHIKRAEEEKDISAVLRRRGEFPDALRRFEDPRNMISGALSTRRTGFPAALQHDLYLRPFECGGPLTNLDGKIVGINIAKSGRIESLAIPGATVAMLLKNVDEGKFYHPELDELQKAKSNIEEEVKRIEEMGGRLKKELDEIAKKLEEITGKK